LTLVEGGPEPAGLAGRVRNMLVSPKAEWGRIEAEPATVLSLYAGYACILAAIGPIAGLIGSQVFGQPGMFGVFRPSLAAAVAAAVLQYLLSLGGVWLLALAIDALAPTFGGTRSRIQALKVAVYASTALWAAQIFQVLPMISMLSLLGVYSFYLLYFGVPKMMKPAEDRALTYIGVVMLIYLAGIIAVAALCDRVANGAA
jgi:hypothetical protein